jgi:DNA-binding MarR family transcriptional regulator
VLPGVDGEAVTGLVLLSRIARLWESTLERHAREHGLQASELRLLTALLLGAAEGLSITRLNEAVVITPGGLTKAVNRLTELAYVTKRVDPADRRGVLVRLTATGRRRTAALLRGVAAEFEDQTGHLPSSDRRQLNASLAALLGTFPGTHQLGPAPEG